MLGAREVDSLDASAGIRALSEAIAMRAPAIFCIHDVGEGDALVLATRFDRGYAYRGGQALFWDASFAASEVLDRYLPATPLRPFIRRGLLQVNGMFNGRYVALIATEFDAERAARVREVRFARTVLRSIDGDAILFVKGLAPKGTGFRDLGFSKIAGEEQRAIYRRMTA
ncbi:MAG TPA: hypothetical protein VMA98_08350 [Candidatus Acidoferrales bacterium]|nr:hypothetical protein [Candidatus Acidoferrales bacterium]